MADSEYITSASHDEKGESNVNDAFDFEYRDLTPTDKAEGCETYIEALEWALHNPKIRNIALAGTYGSGKSSIIETFIKYREAQEKTKSFWKTLLARISCKCSNKKNDFMLKLSMATFLSGITLEHAQENKGDDISEDKTSTSIGGEKIRIPIDEVERGILKQLFYKVHPRKLPQSRYRRLFKMEFWWSVAKTCGGLLFLWMIISVFNPLIGTYIVEDIDLAWQFIYRSIGRSWVYSDLVNIICGGALLLAVSVIAVYIYRKFLSKVSIKEIKLLSDVAASCDNENLDSIFNKNLDEIIYFFEETGYRCVIFEDLDRFDDPKVFIHLRELNNLLNASYIIKDGPIVFIYAVRDDIFEAVDRTKFFDFVIPVVPVITATNSGEILNKILKGIKNSKVKSDISEEFLLDISPYISDMRMLQNICNEFAMYKKTLKALTLSDKKMLAIIVFKNLCPREFSEVQNEGGLIKAAVNCKDKFINVEKKRIQNKIDKHSEYIKLAEDNAIEPMKCFKYEMLGTLMNGMYYFKEFRHAWNTFPAIPAEEFMKPECDLMQLATNERIVIEYHDERNRSESSTVDPKILHKFIERWRLLKECEKSGIKKVKDQHIELQSKKDNLSGLSLSRIIETYSEADVLGGELLKNKVLVFFLRRGYIDETYKNYINYFKEGSITADDMNFVLAVKERSPQNFTYHLEKMEQIIKRLPTYDFKERAIYNFDLLEYLLGQDDTDGKLSEFVRQLSDEETDSWEFINEFIDETAYKDKFIGLLTQSWKGMWSYILRKPLTYDRQILYLKAMLNGADRYFVEAQNIDGCLANYFVQNKDILSKLAGANELNIKAVIVNLRVKFTSLEIEGVSPRVLDTVFDENCYAINDEMCRTIVEWRDSELVEQFDRKPYTTLRKLDYNRMIEYIQDNLSTFVQEIILKHDVVCDLPPDVVDMIERLVDNKELQHQVLCKEKFRLTDIEDCVGDKIRDESEKWESVWKALLNNNKVAVTWKNIVTYWEVYGLNEVLQKYISYHAQTLSAKNVLSVPDDFIKTFIVQDSEIETKKRLLPILPMKEFNIDIQDVNEETLMLLIDIHYFKFDVEMYRQVYSVSENLAIEFVLKNESDYMNVESDITMTGALFEKIMASDFGSENKKRLFSKYAVENMTETIALSMAALGLPVTEEIFSVAWQRVNSSKRDELLLDNCKVLNETDFEKYFNEMRDPYQSLSDRTRLHVVKIKRTAKNESLAKRLEEIGYITSYRHSEKETLDLRVKKVK